MVSVLEETPVDWKKIEEYVVDDLDIVEWDIISNLNDLDEGFVEKFWDHMDWEVISERTDLTWSFIDKFKTMLNWETLTLNYPLSIEFIDEFGMYLDLDIVLGNPSVNEQIVDMYIEMWTDEQWDEISEYVKLSEGFMRKHKDVINWDHISIEQELSSEFIREFSDRVNWKLMSYYQKNIDKDLFIEFKDKFDWVTMALSGKIVALDLIELINCSNAISHSIQMFIDSGKKHPIYCDKCCYSKPIPKHKILPIKHMAKMLSLMWISADVIQYRWKECITNPSFKVCKNVLIRDFEQLVSESTLGY
jgi:hypothetical protein